MKKKLILSVLAAGSIGMSASASAFTLDFEDIAPVNSFSPVMSGMVIDGFTVTTSNSFIVDAGVTPTPEQEQAPEFRFPGFNNTDVFFMQGAGGVTFSNATGFSVTSVDLTSNRIDAPSQNIIVSGTILGGGTVGSPLTFTVDGLADGPEITDFEFFSFLPTDFGSLILSSITFTASDGFSLDNLTGSVVPEPSTAVALGLGFALLGFRRKFKRV